MNKQTGHSGEDQPVAPQPSAAGQPDEAWVQMITEEGYRVLFGLDDDEPGDDDSSPGRR